MKVLIEGAGSAALRLARASIECGLDVRIRSTDPQKFKKFTERHQEKFGEAPSPKIRPNERDEAFALVFIATPGGAHESCLLDINQIVRAQPTDPVKFFEKPLLIDPSLTLQNKIACLSQMTFDSGFRSFAINVARRAFSTGIRRISSQFRESLKSVMSAHQWDPNFQHSWISDDRRGGGALQEFCHPFFWTGEVLKECGLELPRMELTDASVEKIGKAMCTFSASLNGSIGSTTIEISQEILREGHCSKKDICVTFEDNSQLIFDWESSETGYSSEISSKRMVSHLSGLVLGFGKGPHNEIALWADEALKSASSVYLEK